MKFLQMMIFLFTLNISQLTWASIETYPFDTPQQEADYEILIQELRCMVCQNQNLAESNATLAKDLRKQIHSLLVEQKLTQDGVAEFMVERYGDFVLYNPPVKSYTLLLWFGPALFLLLGLWFLIRFIRQQNTMTSGESN